LNFRDFFEACHERAGDVIQRAVRQAIADQVNIYPAVTELYFLVPCKTIADQGQTLVPFHITRTFEELIEDSIYRFL